jgi:hypothetical protein
MRLFDAYLAVDWSSRSKASPARPTRDALWVGEATVMDDVGTLDINESYWSTRKACMDHTRSRLLHHTRRGHRVLIGFDFAYGYPSGYAAALGLAGDAPPWRLIWDELSRLIKDDENNHNNRFEVAAELNANCGGIEIGPMWGCPTSKTLPNLRPKSPKYPFVTRSGIALERLRWADKATAGVQPVWKLFGVGSVGGQCMVGIPAVRSLRDDPELGRFSRVWPFETGFTPTPASSEGPFILHVEIWVLWTIPG